MTKKSLGYVELEWICPSCGNRNPGPAEKCGTCGTPQPPDVEFVQPVQEEILQDEEKIAEAKAGPDIHCGYCGARNPATAENCHQCGASLAEGTARQAGAVLGAHRSAPAPPLICPACGSENPATARFCRACGSSLTQPEPVTPAASKPAKPPAGLGRVALFVFLGIVGLFGLFLVLSSRTSDVVGKVTEASWQRSVAIEELAPATKANWLAEIPEGAPLGQCVQKVKRIQDEPAPGAKEVCGTPYTVDTGSGYGEVVQDCRYEIYEEWCEYTVEEWRVATSAVLQGSDLPTQWPTPELTSKQRAGKRVEQFQVVFQTDDGKEYTYRTQNLALFQKLRPGSRWVLKINKLGGITGLEPAP